MSLRWGMFNPSNSYPEKNNFFKPKEQFEKSSYISKKSLVMEELSVQDFFVDVL
jgi:hypothetical protein